jgi:hypothetical protein
VERLDEPAQGAAATLRGVRGLTSAELRTRRWSKALRPAVPEQRPSTSGNARRRFDARVLNGGKAWGRGDAVRLSARERLRRAERHEEGKTPGITPGPDACCRLAGGEQRDIGEPSPGHEVVATPRTARGKASRASDADTLARVAASGGPSEPGLVLGRGGRGRSRQGPMATSGRKCIGRARSCDGVGA